MGINGKYANDSLGTRMKRYELPAQQNLMRRTYTWLRIDGKAFHTYTKGLKRPFDDGLIDDMNNAAIYACKKIQGAVLAYVQSDEISILMTDFEKITTDAWFDNNVQKMVSVSASLVTTEFNRLRLKRAFSDKLYDCEFPGEMGHYDIQEFIEKFRMAEFDSRVFQVPTQDESMNYLIWRQQDATRNSISSVAQSLYSHKELEGKDSNQKQEMIFQKGTNWNDYPSKYKRGRVMRQNTYINGVQGIIFEAENIEGKVYKTILMDAAVTLPDDAVVRNRWEAVECPIFSQDRSYLTQLIPNNI